MSFPVIVLSTTFKATRLFLHVKLNEFKSLLILKEVLIILSLEVFQKSGKLLTLSLTKLTEQDLSETDLLQVFFKIKFKIFSN